MYELTPQTMYGVMSLDVNCQKFLPPEKGAEARSLALARIAKNDVESALAYTELHLLISPLGPSDDYSDFKAEILSAFSELSLPASATDADRKAFEMSQPLRYRWMQKSLEAAANKPSSKE